ncbi:hypothetical protein WA588_000641 [Blastocystis sp. NMH]
MERNSFLKVVKTLRYNSPSKRQIRRQTGRPKYLNQKVAEPIAVAPEPIKYTKKEVAPFAVTRTKLAKQLPVYSDYRNNRTQRLTVVRRIEGDINEMACELGKVCPGSYIEVHNGSIQIEGNRGLEVRKYLEDLGF